MATQLRQKKAEAEQLALVSAVCDAYSTLEPNPAGDVDDASQVLFGEKLLPPSFEGPGPVAEFLGHELGPALGMSADTAWKLVWDVLALRHRHPVLWNLALTLQVEAWRARMVARMCFGLSEEHARTLDSELGPKLAGWGPVKTRKEVERMRARLDPKAERDRQQARDGRMVDFSPHPRVLGITELDANLDAVDAHHLQATLDMLAHTLKRGGATESMSELRSIALGHLAHPDRAARLLAEDLIASGAMVTPDGEILTGDGEPVTSSTPEATAATAPVAAESQSPRAVKGCRHGATLVLHLNGRELALGGGGWVEGIGAITRAHLEEILTGCRGTVKIQPVIDLAEPLAVSTYKPSAEIVWRVKTRDGREMFPYSERSAFGKYIDLDHSITHASGGPTCTTNLGPLARRSHNAKTSGRFGSVQETPGVFRWKTPLGRVYWTSTHGTWTTPPPAVVANAPDDTTAVILHTILKAAATEATDSAASAAPPPPTSTPPPSAPLPARPGASTLPYDPWEPTDAPPPF